MILGCDSSVCKGKNTSAVFEVILRTDWFWYSISSQFSKYYIIFLIKYRPRVWIATMRCIRGLFEIQFWSFCLNILHLVKSLNSSSEKKRLTAISHLATFVIFAACFCNILQMLSFLSYLEQLRWLIWRPFLSEERRLNFRSMITTVSSTFLCLRIRIPSCSIMFHLWWTYTSEQRYYEIKYFVFHIGLHVCFFFSMTVTALKHATPSLL